MRTFSTLIVTLIISLSLQAQNSLLTNPTTGALPITNNIVDIELVSNGTDVVLIAAAGSGYFYAIDIADNDPADAKFNTVTAIGDFQTLLDATTGVVGMQVNNVEVNPISKSVYVLASGSGQTVIVKIKDNGVTNSVLDYNNMTYSTIEWTNISTYSKMDMTFGNDTLYISSGANFSLDGKVGTVPAPFEHNTHTTNQATTLFKTNWGGQYFTTAPLEKLVYAEINGQSRLLGVTVCAPGFSLPTSSIHSDTLIEVTEDFNVHYSPPVKVVHQNQNGTNYLFDLHSNWPNALMRIGNDFIDGSPVTRNEFNATAIRLRDNGGNVAAGLDSSDLVIYDESYDMIAFWDNYNLLALGSDTLKMLKTGVDQTASVKKEYNVKVILYPNPVTDILNVTLEGSNEEAELTLYYTDGREILRTNINGGQLQLDTKPLPKGNHILKIETSSNKVRTYNLLVQ